MSFRALSSRDAVLSSAENFVLYLLLEAKPQEKNGGARLPLNLGIVLDRSGSMYDEKRLDYVSEAVKYLIDQLGPDDRAAIIAFADKAAVVATADQLQQDKARVKRAIDDIDLLEIGGGTQMALGMEAALAEVEKYYSPSRLNRLLILTDGQTYEERKCLELARTHKGRVTCSTLGVGIEFNEKLLMEMAEASGANYHFISDPASIPGIFSSELVGLRNVALTNARMEVRLSAGVELKEVFRASPQIYPFKETALNAERMFSLPLGDIEAGVATSALLVLVLPPRKPGRVRIAQASLFYDLPGAPGQCESTEAVVTYTLDRAALGKADVYVMNLVDQVSIAKMQMQAEAAAAAGNIDKATRLLGNAIAGTQRLGHTKATQALVSLQNEMKKTQSLTSRAAKTQLLTAQATLRKTQLLDPDSVKEALQE
ncbi:MAG TPA: VWA domain-containing protein [Methylomirabilota bacterium]|jgi:Ca-activated chloride channel family protein|nr:VWA domain-containing protein [Methylomirabilota bacterium]